MFWIHGGDHIYPSLVLGCPILSLSKKLCIPHCLSQRAGRHLLVTFFSPVDFPEYCTLRSDLSSSRFTLPSTHALLLLRSLGLRFLLIVSTFKYSMVSNLLCVALGTVCFPLQFIYTLKCHLGWLSVLLAIARRSRPVSPVCLHLRRKKCWTCSRLDILPWTLAAREEMDTLSHFKGRGCGVDTRVFSRIPISPERVRCERNAYTVSYINHGIERTGKNPRGTRRDESLRYYGTGLCRDCLWEAGSRLPAWSTSLLSTMFT